MGGGGPFIGGLMCPIGPMGPIIGPIGPIGPIIGGLIPIIGGGIGPWGPIIIGPPGPMGPAGCIPGGGIIPGGPWGGTPDLEPRLEPRFGGGGIAAPLLAAKGFEAILPALKAAVVASIRCCACSSIHFW